MKENGLDKWEMVLVSKFGLMGLNMKDIGKIIEQMEEDNFGMLMEIILKENGKMIKHVVKEHIFILMELNMKENG